MRFTIKLQKYLKISQDRYQCKVRQKKSMVGKSESDDEMSQMIKLYSQEDDRAINIDYLTLYHKSLPPFYTSSSDKDSFCKNSIHILLDFKSKNKHQCKAVLSTQATDNNSVKLCQPTNFIIRKQEKV